MHYESRYGYKKLSKIFFLMWYQRTNSDRSIYGTHLASSHLTSEAYFESLRQLPPNKEKALNPILQSPGGWTDGQSASAVANEIASKC